MNHLVGRRDKDINKIKYMPRENRDDYFETTAEMFLSVVMIRKERKREKNLPNSEDDKEPDR